MGVLAILCLHTQACETAKILRFDPLTRANISAVRKVAARVHEEVDARTRSEVAHLSAMLGEDVARSVLLTHGVKTRMWTGTFREGVEWLLAKLGGDASRLPTVMCGGLAARLHDDAFRRDLAAILECCADAKKALPRLVRHSPFVGHIPLLAKWFLAMDTKGKREMESQFGGSYSRKRSRLTEWKCA